jgi:hypothetical protein
MPRSLARSTCVGLALLVCAPLLMAQARPPVRIPLTQLAAAGPERASALIAVSPRGLVAFTTGFDAEGRLITVIDSTGRVIARVVKLGDGPGEFRAPLRLMFADSTLYVFQAARLAAFTHRGVLLWSRAMPPTDLALAVRGDSMDVFSAPDLTRQLSLRRLALTTMQGRTVLALGSSPIHQLSRSEADTTRTVVPGYAPLGSGFVLGNGARYELYGFNAAGQPTAPFGRRALGQPRTGAQLEAEVARRLAAANRPFRGPDGQLRRLPVDEARIRREAAAPPAWFSGRTGGVQADDQGRIIVISPSGDSTALEFFTNTRPSGRVAVPCAGSPVTAAAAGGFLALLCTPRGDSDAEVELQLWRVR